MGIHKSEYGLVNMEGDDGENSKYIYSQTVGVDKWKNQWRK